MEITLYSLSDYNNGELIPKTFDIEFMDKDDYYTAIAEWLQEIDEEKGTDSYIPKREEWIVCDYESIPSHFVGEYDICSTFWEWKEIFEASHLDLEVFEAGAACDIPADKIEDAYYGQHDSDKEFAQQYAEETGALTDNCGHWPYYYIDWERAAHELMVNSYMDDSGYYFSRNW